MIKTMASRFIRPNRVVKDENGLVLYNLRKERPKQLIHHVVDITLMDSGIHIVKTHMSTPFIGDMHTNRIQKLPYPLAKFKELSRAEMEEWVRKYS